MAGDTTQCREREKEMGRKRERKREVEREMEKIPPKAEKDTMP